MYCRYPKAKDLAKYRKKSGRGKKKVPSGCKLVKIQTYACPTKRRSRKRYAQGSKPLTLDKMFEQMGMA